jgi:hypothetical protein
LLLLDDDFDDDATDDDDGDDDELVLLSLDGLFHHFDNAAPTLPTPAFSLPATPLDDDEEGADGCFVDGVDDEVTADVTVGDSVDVGN